MAGSRARKANHCPLPEFLRRARGELLALLFADVVHGLGNALGNLQGRAEMLRSRPLPEETAHHYLDLILEKADHVSTILRAWVGWLNRDDAPESASLAPAPALAACIAPLKGLLPRRNLSVQAISLPETCTAEEYQRLEAAALGVLLVCLAAPPERPGVLVLESPKPGRFAVALAPDPPGKGEPAAGKAPPPSPAYLKGRAAALRERLGGLAVRVEQRGGGLTLVWTGAHG